VSIVSVLIVTMHRRVHNAFVLSHKLVMSTLNFTATKILSHCGTVIEVTHAEETCARNL